LHEGRSKKVEGRENGFRIKKPGAGNIRIYSLFFFILPSSFCILL